MSTWIIFAILYVLVVVGTFCFITSKWNRSVFQNFWFALFWPATLLAWFVHLIYNKWIKKEQN